MGAEEQDRLEAVRKMRQGEKPMTFKEIADVLGCKPQDVAKLARVAEPEAEVSPAREEPAPQASGKPDVDDEIFTRIEQEERARAAVKLKIEGEKKAEKAAEAKKRSEDATKAATKITLGCLAVVGLCVILGLVFHTGDEDWQNQYYLADHYANEARGYYAVGEDELAIEAMQKSMEHRKRGDRIKARSGGR